jgi:hypothetical protein
MGPGELQTEYGATRDELDVWVAVEAIDAAGNVSARSEAMRVYSANDGCRVGVPGRTSDGVALLLACGLLFVRARNGRAQHHGR